MRSFLLRRSFSSVISLVAVVCGVFTLVRLTGDPASVYLNENATAAERHAFDVRNGFDQPILEQLGRYAGQLVHLNFGRSIMTGEPATDTVFRALPYTLRLASITFVLVVILALPLGSYMACRPNSLIDRTLGSVAVALGSIPDFWFALIAIFVFAVKLDLVPTSGTESNTALVLPVLTLFLRPFGVLLQVVRSAMLSAMTSPYVKFARAKGASEMRVVLVHGLRNAALPALTVAGDLAIHLFNGSAIVETIFGWPGVGSLVVRSIQQRDFVVVQTAVIVLALMIFAWNLFIDLCYIAADPRVRTKGEV